VDVAGERGGRRALGLLVLFLVLAIAVGMFLLFELFFQPQSLRGITRPGW